MEKIFKNFFAVLSIISLIQLIDFFNPLYLVFSLSFCDYHFVLMKYKGSDHLITFIPLALFI